MKIKFTIMILLGLVVSAGILFYLYKQLDSGDTKSSLIQSDSFPTVYENRDGTLLCFDASMSVCGFFRTKEQCRLNGNRGTTIQRFIWEGIEKSILEIFSLKSIKSDSLNFLFFGDTLSQQKRNLSLLNEFSFDKIEDLNRMFYGKQTALLDLFENEKLFSSKILSVILTDGIPSMKNEIGVEPRITRIVNNLINKGNHIWLIGIRSEFDGYIHSQCIDRSGERVRFLYKGSRPFFLWIITSDISLGVSITNHFVIKLRNLINDNLEIAADSLVKYIEISSISLPSPIFSLKPAPQVKFFIESAKPKQISFRIANNFVGDFAVFPIDRSIDFNELCDDIAFNMQIQLHDNDTSSGIKLDSSDSSIPQWQLIIPKKAENCQPFQLIYSICKKRPEWTTEWSTIDDSRQQDANKTLYLDSMVCRLRSNVICVADTIFILSK